MIEKAIKELELIRRGELIEARELTVKEKLELRKMFPEIKKRWING